MLRNLKRLYRPQRDSKALADQASRLSPFMFKARRIVDRYKVEIREIEDQARFLIKEITAQAQKTQPVVLSDGTRYARAYKKKVIHAARTGQWKISPRDNRFTVAAPRLKILECVSDRLADGVDVTDTEIARETGLGRSQVQRFMARLRRTLQRVDEQGGSKHTTLVLIHHKYKERQRWLEQGWHPAKIEVRQ